MAVANSVAAVQAGAVALSATVNGLGERAGNAAIEEVAAALTHAAGRPVHFHWPSLLKLCHLVARVSGRPLPRNKPLTGADVFTHESGIHCAAMLRDPLSYQPLDPAAVGRGGTVFTAGRHSGSAILQHLLATQGIHLARSDLTPLLGGTPAAPGSRSAPRCRAPGGLVPPIPAPACCAERRMSGSHRQGD